MALDNLKSDFSVVFAICHNYLKAGLDELKLHSLIVGLLLCRKGLCAHRFLLLDKVEDGDGRVPQFVSCVLYLDNKRLVT
jgi:hypothetical protein